MAIRFEVARLNPAWSVLLVLKGKKKFFAVSGSIGGYTSETTILQQLFLLSISTVIFTGAIILVSAMLSNMDLII